MKPTLEMAAPPGACAVSVDVAACGTVRVTADMLPALRQQPGGSLPAAFLKHTDDQTVAGLAAVYQAIQRGGLTDTSFTHWGVLAAPRFLGRSATASALHRFAAEGAWGISPHLIPHRSLHAISGTVSQALHIHGPNLGVGGGPNSVTEVLLAATALLDGGQVPGLWVVMTAWDPEPIPTPQGRVAPDSQCGAVALAVVPSRCDWHGLRIRLSPPLPLQPITPLEVPVTELTIFGLQQILAAVLENDTPSATVIWSLGSGGWIEFRRGGDADAPANSQRNGSVARNGSPHPPSSVPVRPRISSNLPESNGAGAENQR